MPRHIIQTGQNLVHDVEVDLSKSQRIDAAGLANPPPAITNPVTIDGYSQRPCSAPNVSPCSQVNTQAESDDAILLIELNGANAGANVHGLVVNAFSGIQGLAINRFSG